MRISRRFFVPGSLIAGVVLVSRPRPVLASGLNVLAASSLTEAMQDVSRAWAASGHDPLVLSFGSSAALARQLGEGAPAVLFISADTRWMDWAQSHALIADATRRDIVGNSLVMVGPKTAAQSGTIGHDFDLRGFLGADGRLAVGDPASVPAGLYAREALQSLGLWADAEPRLARAENVRAALLLVERGEAAAGIVYATDALTTPDLAVIGTFPPASHSPIVYPAAVTRSGDSPQARALLDFLGGPEATAIFARRGFSRP